MSYNEPKKALRSETTQARDSRLSQNTFLTGRLGLESPWASDRQGGRQAVCARQRGRVSFLHAQEGVSGSSYWSISQVVPTSLSIVASVKETGFGLIVLTRCQKKKH